MRAWCVLAFVNDIVMSSMAAYYACYIYRVSCIASSISYAIYIMLCCRCSGPMKDICFAFFLRRMS